MKFKQLLSIVALSGAACVPGLAQEQKMSQAAGQVEVLPADAGLAEGEVRRVDKANLRITLKHGEIRNLDMPPMTMVFQLRDGAQLDRVKVGDRVRFRAVNEAGKYMVTEIRPMS